MKKLIIIFLAFMLVSCGMTDQELYRKNEELLNGKLKDLGELLFLIPNFSPCSFHKFDKS